MEERIDIVDLDGVALDNFLSANDNLSTVMRNLYSKMRCSRPK